MYHPKFYGLTSTVLSRVGKCYRVEITDVNKKKVLFIHPVHLRGCECVNLLFFRLSCSFGCRY